MAFACCIPAPAQTGTLKGIVLDEITGRPVEYSHVYNYSRNLSVYSNPSGEFYMNAFPGDTLVLTTVGYYYQKVIVTDSMLHTANAGKFPIRPRVYEISEARILPLSTYGEFKQRFIGLDKPKTGTEVLAENLADASQKAAKESFYNAQANQKLDGITLLTIPIRTPEEKERLELARIMKQERIRNHVYQKFNPEVVKKVTGLIEDHEIIEFILFCQFSDQYLLSVNQYDLMERIARKYEEFKRRKYPPPSGDFPVNRVDDLFNPSA